MELLQKAIKEKGKVLPGNILKVGAFLNNQIDVKLLAEMGKEIRTHFRDCEVTKILTVEASGIGLACITAQFFDCNVVFAKKTKTANVDGGLYTAECFSYTHKKSNTLIVPSEFLNKDDKVLIIDDFLAHGEAVNALMKIVEQAGAEFIGVAIAIEKGFQKAGDEFRAKGINLCSLAIVDEMTDDGKISFRN